MQDWSDIGSRAEACLVLLMLHQKGRELATGGQVLLFLLGQTAR